MHLYALTHILNMILNLTTNENVIEKLEYKLVLVKQTGVFAQL